MGEAEAVVEEEVEAEVTTFLKISNVQLKEFLLIDRVSELFRRRRWRRRKRV